MVCIGLVGCSSLLDVDFDGAHLATSDDGAVDGATSGSSSGFAGSSSGIDSGAGSNSGSSGGPESGSGSTSGSTGSIEQRLRISETPEQFSGGPATFE
jgi:hypothetical protein